MALVYLDTSAFAKWYFPEAGADLFEEFLLRQAKAALSRLTVLEFRCLLARRRRNREIDRRLEQEILLVFYEDLGSGFLELIPLRDGHAIAAETMLARSADIPLRSLDALHLAVAVEEGCAGIATADAVMRGAALAAGLEVAYFG